MSWEPLAECFRITPARRVHFVQDAERAVQNHITRWWDDRFARKYQKQLGRIRAAKYELLAAVAELPSAARKELSDYMERRVMISGKEGEWWDERQLEQSDLSKIIANWPSLERCVAHVNAIDMPGSDGMAGTMHEIGPDGRRKGKYIRLSDGKELDTQHEGEHELERILLLNLCEIATAYGGQVTLGSKENPTGTIWKASEWLRENLPPKSFDRVSPGWLAKVKREHSQRKRLKLRLRAVG